MFFVRVFTACDVKCFEYCIIIQQPELEYHVKYIVMLSALSLGFIRKYFMRIIIG